MYEYYFERMRIWQNARELTNIIYNLTKQFPKEEEFHLKSQMRRSASSVKSIIAEGQGRKGAKDQLHFTNLSYSSLIELLNHLITALDQKYVSNNEYLIIRNKIEHIGNQLHKLRNTQEKRIK